MATADDFVSTLKQQADIVRVVGEYVTLKRSGAQNYSGLCPFHKEKTPSFSVHASRQFYHCFGCGASGDVLSFIQKIEDVSFSEALRILAQKLGIPLPRATYGSPYEARETRLRGLLLELHERACSFFQEQLERPESAHAREYLASRGVTQDSIREFRIGYAPDTGFLLRDRLVEEFGLEALKASGLFSWKDLSSEGASASSPRGKQTPVVLYSRFRDRIMFPICNESGRVIAFTARALRTDEKTGPKYLNSPETKIYSKSQVLFNLDKAKEHIRKLGYAILVEGQMDCISVFAARFKNVIASSGTAFTEAQARLLGRFSRNIVVNFDPDNAGAAAAERTLSLLLAEDFTIKILTLEAGLDPDLFLRQRGRDAYEEALRRASPYFDFLIERARGQFPVGTAQGKVKALNYLLPYIHQVPNRIARDQIAGEIAQKLAIDSAVLRQELKQAAVVRSSKPIAVKEPASDLLPYNEEMLVRALFAEDGNWALRRSVRSALLAEPLHRGLRTESLLQKLIEADDSCLDNLELDPSEREHLAMALMPPKIHHRHELSSEALEDVLASRRQYVRAGKRREQIRQEIGELARRGDIEAARRLMAEQAELDKALRANPRLTQNEL